MRQRIAERAAVLPVRRAAAREPAGEPGEPSEPRRARVALRARVLEGWVSRRPTEGVLSERCRCRSSVWHGWQEAPLQTIARRRRRWRWPRACRLCGDAERDQTADRTRTAARRHGR